MVEWIIFVFFEAMKLPLPLRPLLNSFPSDARYKSILNR
jgi:hypothetical protein